MNIPVDRAISLSPMFHSKNLELIINLLLNNAYLVKLIFDTINRRFKTNLLTNHIHLINSPLIFTQMTVIKKNFLVIPYVKPISKMISSIFYKSDTIVGFRCLNKLNR